MWNPTVSRHHLDTRQTIIVPDPPEPPTPDPGTLTLTLDVPSNTEVQSGDLLIALISTDGNPTITRESGWVLEDQIGGTAKSYIDLNLSDGSEPATYDWTLDGAEDAQCVAFAGSIPAPCFFGRVYVHRGSCSGNLA